MRKYSDYYEIQQILKLDREILTNCRNTATNELFSTQESNKFILLPRLTLNMTPVLRQ